MWCLFSKFVLILFRLVVGRVGGWLIRWVGGAALNFNRGCVREATGKKQGKPQAANTANRRPSPTGTRHRDASTKLSPADVNVEPSASVAFSLVPSHLRHEVPPELQPLLVRLSSRHPRERGRQRGPSRRHRRCRRR